MSDSPSSLESFIVRWQASAAAERANYQLFLTELCDLLGVDKPHPTQADVTQNVYVFERDVTFHNQDGSTSLGRIDLYKRGCFVLEAKQGSQAAAEAEPVLSSAPKKLKKGHGVRGTKGWDDAMLRARGQAEQYARALPVDEGWPVFLIVVDVGHSIELFADFTRNGKTYLPFPDPKSYRVLLPNLADAVPLLQKVWTDPQSLDPTRRAAKVTRELADKLARLAKSLEQSKFDPGRVAQFLMRCLFTMFAEDVDLIPRDSFRHMLERLKPNPAKFPAMVRSLWEAMDKGTFHPVLEEKLRRFNGGLFEDCEALPLTADQLQLLHEASKAEWRDVEPAIFGTLLERALDPIERHKLGAHYTPRAYVERLVMPTIIEPLREEWDNCRTVALTLANRGETEDAVKTVRDFHRQLCETRVLDPACGSGNFLYVALEHMKRLEGEVLNTLRDLGYRQREIITVDPHQFLGIEVNPRAAAIADLVLWIGYLQWHVRTRPLSDIVEPIIQKFHNIDCRDAVLAWDSVEPVLDAQGQPVTRWDGRTMKKHPVTGEDVPDDTARVPVVKYINPRKAEWPEAEYIVGNPPFIGNWRMRQALGEGYAECIRATYKTVPEACDYVMYWWELAAIEVQSARAQRFGFITTNSLRQKFSRRVLARFLDTEERLSLNFAIPDHPWVDSADGAAVRIAMTIASLGESDGRLVLVDRESPSPGGEADISFTSRTGRIQSDLSIGANVSATIGLLSNSGISSRGVSLHGAGFIVTQTEAAEFGWGNDGQVNSIIRQYRNGRDLAGLSRNAMVIDLFGLTEEQVRTKFPQIYQRIYDRVKPERDHNNRSSYRDKWWIFGEARSSFRPALKDMNRYIATVETTKHRAFQFLDGAILPDNMIVAIALGDGSQLAILSSRIHVVWSLAAGGRLGVGNDPRYNKTRCFEPFPFPVVTEDIEAQLRNLGEQLDAHRKKQQALHPDLTLTGMYNVLEKLRSGEPLTAKEKVIHEQGLVSVLKQIHDDLDAAVFDAYGWPHDLTDEQILERLVALNAERAAEEARGLIRWLRPEFQNPTGGVQKQIALADKDDTDEDEEVVPLKKGKATKATTKTAKTAGKVAWPKTLSGQVKAVADELTTAAKPITAEDVAKRFTRGKVEDVTELLDALVTMGKARTTRGGKYVAA